MSFLLEFKKPSNEPHHVNPQKIIHSVITNIFRITDI